MIIISFSEQGGTADKDTLPSSLGKAKWRIFVTCLMFITLKLLMLMLMLMLMCSCGFGGVDALILTMRV